MIGTLLAAALLPALAAELAAAADSFDRVRYLGQPGSEAEYRAVARLEAELRGIRPPVFESALSG